MGWIGYKPGWLLAGLGVHWVGFLPCCFFPWLAFGPGWLLGLVEFGPRLGWLSLWAWLASGWIDILLDPNHSEYSIPIF